jgi:hypothetical protein
MSVLSVKSSAARCLGLKCHWNPFPQNGKFFKGIMLFGFIHELAKESSLRFSSMRVAGFE